MSSLLRRDWVADGIEDFVLGVANEVAVLSTERIEAIIDNLVAENRRIHEEDCINLNPATNVMNPRAEALLAQGLGSRPSLGYPTEKYEMGLEAIEKIEVITAELAAEIFGASFAEIRVGSGALANLYAFMATTRPGDSIIVPPASIGGHVTHHQAGAAGLYGLTIHSAPVNKKDYALDYVALKGMVSEIRPKLITIGGSMNLQPWNIGAVREIADSVGSRVLFDGAHLCGLFAGKAWPNPLAEGADLLTMSTYKSLGGPAGGLVLTNEPELAKRLDHIAYPGLTANFDAAKSAALAVTLLDWREYGEAYAKEMIRSAQALAKALVAAGIPVVETAQGATGSHQLAVRAARYGGGQAAAKKLRKANILSSGIGLPEAPVAGDVNGLRLGTPEIVRWGMRAENMDELGSLIAEALEGDHPQDVAVRVCAFRNRFRERAFIRN